MVYPLDSKIPGKQEFNSNVRKINLKLIDVKGRNSDVFGGFVNPNTLR